MDIHPEIVKAINREKGQGNRMAERVLCDMLLEVDDPHGEALAWLLRKGKRPWCPGARWLWVPEKRIGEGRYYPEHVLLDNCVCPLGTYYSYFLALNAAIVERVRFYRAASAMGFEPDELTERVN